jgi:hypothetical protein
LLAECKINFKEFMHYSNFCQQVNKNFESQSKLKRE